MITILSWQLGAHHVLPQLILAASCNPYNAWMVSGAKCAGMEETPKYFAEDKRNLSHWPCSLSHSILKVHIWICAHPAHYFLCQRHVILQIHDSSSCISYSFSQIVEVWITRPSTCFINHKLCRFLSSIVPSTFSPIICCDLVWKCSRFGGHVHL